MSKAKIQVIDIEIISVYMLTLVVKAKMNTNVIDKQ